MDYDDLLGLAVALLQSNPQLLQSLQARYQHICVDEFQVGCLCKRF
jgi:superfamily I DNA/RNA helicase